MSIGILELELESELPNELRVGRGTALFLYGSCFAPGAGIRRLWIDVGGERQPVMAHSMPRLETLRAHQLEGDRDPHSYASGFWGIARIAALDTASPCTLGLVAELDHGGEAAVDVASISVVSSPEPQRVEWPAGAAGPRVAICMATYNPPDDLLAGQLDSIRGQTHQNWICVISDDCSSFERYGALERALEGDPRFVLSRSPRRLGFYSNFERALTMAPADADYVALADQDDVWHRDKLETLLAAAIGATLVYSDARVVSRDGDQIAPSWWTHRRNNHSDLEALLLANSITGAASLFGRELLDYALPFPPAQFTNFHDHWIGLVGLSLGEVAFVDRPLYDYVQHGNASLGHAAANRLPSRRQRLQLDGALRERIRDWRLHYFVDVCRLLVLATVLELRCAERMSPDKRAALKRFLASDRNLGSLAALAVRGARQLVGRPETLGAEWMLFYALTWRRMLALSARGRPQRHLRLDAQPPAPLRQQPSPTRPAAAAGELADKIAPLRWAPAEDAPPRINLLIPTVDLTHFFGGYIAKLNLARRLSELGHRVRIVTVDPSGPLPSAWRRQVEAYSGLAGLFDTVEVAFGRESLELELSHADTFIATTWWTAHIANDALALIDGEHFLYLVQEYEPFTFPMGTYAALAAASYAFPHSALFSSELLRDYFRRHQLGVYALGPEHGDAASASFENAITDVSPVSAQTLAERRPRRLLFYARPEAHAARNMFELGVLALSRALADGAFQAGWELHGIGTVSDRDTISLGSGAGLTLLPRADQRAYAELLAQHDVGLALMYTPHPSLVPIEMAAAGMVTVTNSFENKTPEALLAISTNLIAAPPTIDGVAAALIRASAEAEDTERRVNGSEVSWSRNWRDSFDGDVLEQLLGSRGAMP